MKGEWLLWAMLTVLIAALAGLAGFGVLPIGMVLLTIVLTSGIAVAAFKAAEGLDRSWLPAMALGAFVVKLAGAVGRYAILVYRYDSVGDAIAYHDRGVRLAEVWRSFSIPTGAVGGSSGTQFVSKVTGLLYVPYSPPMIGGFFIYATLAFLGQLLLYVAYRRSEPHSRRRLYAAAILFLPSMVFWPASIGKEALMLLPIGVVAYSVARLVEKYQVRWTIPMAASLWFMSQIRVHIAALLVVAVTITIVLSRGPEGGSSSVRRIAMIGASAIAVVLVVTLTSETFGIDPSGSDLDPFLNDLERRTQQGGSAVEGEAVRSPAEFPGAVVRVLFRPLPIEAHNSQALISGIESTVLLAVILWRLPTTLRNIGSLRKHPYLMFSIAYSIGFVIAFSAIFNLGIIARQRIQVLPMLLAALVGLGWSSTERSENRAPRRRAAARPRHAR